MPADPNLLKATDGPVLVGVDVGTSSVRVIAFDARGRRLAAAAQPTPVRIVATGGEYDPDAIFEAVVTALAEVASALSGRPVAGIATQSGILAGRSGALR